MDIPEYAIDDNQMRYYREVVEFDKSLNNEDRNEMKCVIDFGYSLNFVIAVKKVFPNKSIKECFAFLNNPDNWCGAPTRLTMFLYQREHEYVRNRLFENFGKETIERGTWSVAVEDFLSELCGFKWVQVGGNTYGVYEHGDHIVKQNQYIVKVESKLTEEYLVYASSPDEAIERYYEKSATGFPILNRTSENKTTKEVSVVGSRCSGKTRLNDRQ